MSSQSCLSFCPPHQMSKNSRCGSHNSLVRSIKIKALLETNRFYELQAGPSFGATALLSGCALGFVLLLPHNKRIKRGCAKGSVLLGHMVSTSERWSKPGSKFLPPYVISNELCYYGCRVMKTSQSILFVNETNWMFPLLK